MKELQVDIGNTRAKYRVVDREGSSFAVKGTCQPGELPALVVEHDVAKVLIACVATSSLRNKLSQAFATQGVSNIFWAQTEPGYGAVVNGYEQYLALGVDRWLGVVAAFAKFQRACCVFDFGSAVTVDMICARGQHLGGFIVPGSGLSFAALGQNTAALHPALVLSESEALGTNTEVCIQNGIFIQQMGFVSAILKSLTDEYVVCTGGGFKQIEKAFSGMQYAFEADLVLDGLEMVANKRKPMAE